ncbi:MAG: transposase [Planctomycetota bacterium]|jgi:hypothetical protein
MITTTSYGSWLPGDLRGFVEGGRLLPPSPALEKHAAQLIRDDPILFDQQEQQRLAEALVTAAAEFDYQLFCLSVEAWHVHWLIDCRTDRIARMVGRLKTRMRQALERGRIWTTGYDKRYCYTISQVRDRFAYIARHRGFRAIGPIRID